MRVRTKIQSPWPWTQHSSHSALSLFTSNKSNKRLNWVTVAVKECCRPQPSPLPAGGWGTDTCHQTHALAWQTDHLYFSQCPLIDVWAISKYQACWLRSLRCPSDTTKETLWYHHQIAPIPVQSWSEVKVAQWCPTLCDPMDYIVHGILQARSSCPRNRTRSPAL